MSTQNIDEDKIVAELSKEFPIEEEVSFNEFTLQDKLKNNSFKIMQYGQLLNRESMRLKELQHLLDRLIGERYHYYRFEYDEQLTPKEIEKYYLQRDEKINQMKKILLKQEVRVKFFEICVKALEAQGWRMKEFSENLRRGI